PGVAFLSSASISPTRRSDLAKQTSLLAKSERRVGEIEAELKNATPGSFLPPVAPLDEVHDPLRPN
ncbi:MAG: hypothetical protein ACKOTF_16545, partial [Opitutaceae bacterium]